MEEVVEYKAEVKTESPLTVCLGRYGDILANLPHLYQEFLKTGQKQRVLVAKKYQDVLIGCSYIEPIVYDGDFADLPGAIEYAKKLTSDIKIPQVAGYRPFILSQVYGSNIKIAQENYQKEMWALSGKLAEWKYQHPLVFTNRHPELEKALIPKLQKPRSILISTSGVSSPFQHSKLLQELIRLKFGRSYNIIDLAEIKAPRIFDLLGLMESAEFLIATDSALLHLAYAVDIPVVALVADAPSMWHGSQYRANHIAHVRYSQFPKYATDIMDAMLKVGRIGSQWNKKLVNNKRIIHVWSHFDMSPDARKRHDLARQTWETEYETNQWIESEVPEGAFYRNSKTALKDDRECVFLKDVVKFGMLKAKEGDIICLTNSDSCLKPGITNEILAMVEKHGAVHSHRRDFTKLERPLTLGEIEKGKHYPGSDLFAFTREWWFEHMNECPDLICGCEGIDKILRALIMKYGGAEIKHGVYHVYHDPYWMKPGIRENNVANRHNRKLAKEWLRKNNMPQDELAQFRD